MEERILEYLDALESALSTHGQAIADSALVWARIDAASGLVYGVAFAALVFIFYVIARWLHRWAKDDWDERELPCVFGVVVLVIFGGILLVNAFDLLFNIWRWVGIFSPEMWLVHKAISAAT